MNSYKIRPKFPEDDGVRFPEELAKESAEHLKKAGYDASVVDKYYVQVNGDVDESELSRWGTIMNSRIIKSDATDDIITPAHSDYFDALEDLFDRFNVQYRDSYVINGGRIFYIEPGQVEFKHPNSGEYVPLLMAQLYADGTVYLSDKKYSGGWSTINIPLEEVFVKVNDDTYMNYLSEDKSINSSRQIKSARYIATDPETGEVLGSADTYEEAVNEWGEDVTITDSEAAEGQQEEEGLFSSYEEETEEDDMEIESSNHLNGDKAFLSKIVSSFVSGSMTEEQAVKRIALRNNCNQAFARNILSSAMDDASLIQSGTMEIAEDLNKDFNVDGDIESWSEDYIPQAGKANTIGGEILRATAQIVNRFYNDGDKIGIGNGKETVNPAARYILENAVEFSAVPDDLQAMLDNDSDINLSDESYEEWVDDFKYEVEDYLREHEELFHAPNKVDMWDFKQESDEKTPITDIFIEDDDGNRYSFQGGPEGWHCYDIYFANGPKYNVGDFVNSGDIQTAGGDTSEEFVTFNIDGYTYSAELYDNDEYEITDIESSNQLVHKDEEWTTEDLERYNIYNSEDESEISIEDLY